MTSYKEHTTKSNHKIKIWDNLLNYQQQSRIASMMNKIPFGFNVGYDTVMLEQKGKVSCKSMISADWLKRNNFLNANHIGPITFEDIAYFYGLEDAHEVREALKGKVLLRAWVNAGTVADPHSTHVDSNHPNALVLLQMINLKWDINWDGYTIFRTPDLKELEFVSDFVPGRVILFDGDIPHKAAAQSYDAPNFRFTANSMWTDEEDYLKQVRQ